MEDFGPFFQAAALHPLRWRPVVWKVLETPPWLCSATIFVGEVLGRQRFAAGEFGGQAGDPAEGVIGEAFEAVGGGLPELGTRAMASVG